MEIAWITFWYLTLILMFALVCFLVMSLSLYFSVKNDIEIKKVDLAIRKYDDERADRDKFAKMAIKQKYEDRN